VDQVDTEGALSHLHRGLRLLEDFGELSTGHRLQILEEVSVVLVGRQFEFAGVTAAPGVVGVEFLEGLLED